MSKFPVQMMKIVPRTYLQQEKKRNIIVYYILIWILAIFLQNFWKYFKYLLEDQEKFVLRNSLEILWPLKENC